MTKKQADYWSKFLRKRKPNGDITQHARGLLATLSPREEKILRALHGLAEPIQSHEAVGQRLAISASWVRQLEKRAIQKITGQMRPLTRQERDLQRVLTEVNIFNDCFRILLIDAQLLGRADLLKIFQNRKVIARRLRWLQKNFESCIKLAQQEPPLTTD